MNQPNDVDQTLREILRDHKEKVVSALGEKFLNHLDDNGEPRQSVLVLSDRRLYQLGPFYEPDGNGEYRKSTGKNLIALADLTGLGTTERPVAKWVSRIGTGLLVIGLGILLAGLIDGSGLGLVIGLFIGAVWMAVPGGLMLFHAKTEGEKYLDVMGKGGTLSVSCRPYSQKELETFSRAVTSAMQK